MFHSLDYIYYVLHALILSNFKQISNFTFYSILYMYNYAYIQA